jgi:hypothetical protein
MPKKPAPPKAKTLSDTRSGYERKLWKFLQSNDVDFSYESVSIPYKVPVKNRRYTPDFILFNGIYVEAKGKLDAKAREKMQLVVEQHPDLDIRILLMRDNKISKQSKTRYSDWCRKVGIKYHVSEHGEIPPEWMEERKDG